MANTILGENIKYYSEIARSHKRVQHSVNASVKLDRLLRFMLKQKQGFGDLTKDESYERAVHKLNFWCKHETAASNWLMGEQKFPIAILRSLISDDSAGHINKRELPFVYSTLVSILVNCDSYKTNSL